MVGCRVGDDGGVESVKETVEDGADGEFKCQDLPSMRLQLQSHPTDTMFACLPCLVLRRVTMSLRILDSASPGLSSAKMIRERHLDGNGVLDHKR